MPTRRWTFSVSKAHSELARQNASRISLWESTDRCLNQNSVLCPAAGTASPRNSRQDPSSRHERDYGYRRRIGENARRPGIRGEWAGIRKGPRKARRIGRLPPRMEQSDHDGCLIRHYVDHNDVDHSPCRRASSVADAVVLRTYEDCASNQRSVSTSSAMDERQYNNFWN